MIFAILGIGVGRWPEPQGGFDVWWPAFVLLALVLVWAVAGLRITWRTQLAAFIGGTLWSWTKDVTGVLPACAAAVLVAFAWGELVRRRARRSA